MLDDEKKDGEAGSDESAKSEGSTEGDKAADAAA